MCTKPSTVFLYRWPSEEKWHTRYYGNMTRDEAVREGLDIDVKTSSAHGLVSKWCTVSCGQCIECRLQRSRTWANRCLVESVLYPELGDTCSNWFVTLTISPECQARFMTNSNVLSLDFGREGGRDVLQQFMVNLRQNYQRKLGFNGVRFLACGEYGATTFRPHYHLILLNAPLNRNDLLPTFKNKFGHQFYKSKFLERAWPFGFVDISEASWDNMAYTARYVVKKITGDAADDFYGDLKPPFLRSSRRPGIGFNGFKGYKTYHKDFDFDAYDDLIDLDTGELVGLYERVHEGFVDRVVFDQTPAGMDATFKVPRYYDKLMERFDPTFIDIVRKIRSDHADIAYNTAKALRPMSDRDMFDNRQYSLEQSAIGQFRHLDDIF